MVELLGYLTANGFTQLHRVRRRPRLHAADQPRGLRHPATARHRQRRGVGLHQRRAGRDDHAQAASSTTSTTAPRSRSASGAAPDDGRCSRPATPTATSRCWTSPNTPTSRPCACSSSTTTPSASSTTPPEPSRRSRGPARQLDRHQRQERLGHRLLTRRAARVARMASAVRRKTDQRATVLTTRVRAHAVSPGAGVRSSHERLNPCTGVRVARPTGFEPVTFGSVDRGSEAYIWLCSAKSSPTGRQ